MNKNTYGITLTSDQERLLAYAGGIFGSMLANPGIFIYQDEPSAHRRRSWAIKQAAMLIEEVKAYEGSPPPAKNAMRSI